MTADSADGISIKIPVVFSGQNGVGSLPDSAHTVARTWVLHISVGAVPFAKYSVYTALPLGSAEHTPETASLPDFRQISAVSMLSGTGNPVSGSPSCTRVIIFLQMSLWKEVPPLLTPVVLSISFWLLSQPPHTPAV